jgi:hypothetical protein
LNRTERHDSESLALVHVWEHDKRGDEENETWLESSGLRERMAEAAPAACRVTRPDTAAFLMYESSSRKSADASARGRTLSTGCEPLMKTGCLGQSAGHTGQLGDGILPRDVVLVVQPCRALGVGSDDHLARWCRREEEVLDGDQPRQDRMRRGRGGDVYSYRGLGHRRAWPRAAHAPWAASCCPARGNLRYASLHPQTQVKTHADESV